MNLYPIISDIFKRILLKYFPLSLLLSILTSFMTRNIIFYEAGTVRYYFISLQLVMLTSWSIIIMAIYILKPIGFIKVLSSVTIALLCGVIIQYFVSALFLGFNLWPFNESELANKIIVMLFMNTVWCGGTFFLAVKSIVAEKKYEKEKTRRLKSEKELMENKLGLLQARIEPQFLFNTMESISGLFDTAPEKAKKLLIHFIQYLRVSLVKSRKQYTTIKQEMEIIRSYLEIFKTGMDDRFEYSIKTDPQITDISFPSMLLQPVVENALMNSIDKNSDHSQIIIMVNKIEDRIHINISDTGKGSSEADKDNILFSDIKERLVSLYNEKGILRLDNNMPSGLSVTIEVPRE